jgi:hypothetical protein
MNNGARPGVRRDPKLSKEQGGMAPSRLHADHSSTHSSCVPRKAPLLTTGTCSPVAHCQHFSDHASECHRGCSLMMDLTVVPTAGKCCFLTHDLQISRFMSETSVRTLTRFAVLQPGDLLIHNALTG